ncbi:MAG TPA: hypothetical protein VE262_13925 [Blastocatellia bacterium]|nr:hypothetical protein [Blastocatellia bacterium]
MAIYARFQRGVKLACLAPVLCMTLSAPSLGQATPPLLGASDMSAQAVRTPVGFTLHARGFIERDNPKRARKTIGFLSKQGAPHLVPSFVDYAESVSDYWFLLEQTDEVWRATRDRWVACGGRYEQVAKSMSPRRITIYIEDRPFTHPAHPGLKLNGLTDGRMIRAVILSTNGMKTDPRNAWLVTYRQVLEWEMGNLLGAAMGVPFTGVGNEIGSNSPCN